MRHSDNQHSLRFDSVDDAEREAAEQVSAGSLIKPRPCFWELRYGGLGRIDFLAEGQGGGRAALGVPTGRSLGLV